MKKYYKSEDRERKTGKWSEGKRNIVKLDEPAGVIITRCRHFRNAESAKSWGSRFGTVLACHKVDDTRYTRNIEYRCKDCISVPPPLEVPIDREEFTITKDLELVRGIHHERKFSIDLVDKSQ